jgi:hypothetical protein
LCVCLLFCIYSFIFIISHYIIFHEEIPQRFFISGIKMYIVQSLFLYVHFQVY